MCEDRDSGIRSEVFHPAKMSTSYSPPGIDTPAYSFVDIDGIRDSNAKYKSGSDAVM